MKTLMIKPLNTLLVALAMTATAYVAVAPLQPVMAQARALPDFTDLVEQVGPSVVNIRTMEKVSTRTAQGGPGDEEMLEFFRRFGLPTPNMPGNPRQVPRQNRPQQEEEQPRGVGSGFILTADGFIMTNAHVVDGADEVLVTLTDKREFKAKIIGADKRSDVAVVKIEATGLPAVRVGDVSRLKVGVVRGSSSACSTNRNEPTSATSAARPPARPSNAKASVHRYCRPMPNCTSENIRLPVISAEYFRKNGSRSTIHCARL